MINDPLYLIPGLIMFAFKSAIIILILWYMLYVSKKIKQINEKLDSILNLFENLKLK